LKIGPACYLPGRTSLKILQYFFMELKLIRALFPNSTMAQLYKNGKMLCMYIGMNNQAGTPVEGLPDGRYSLRKPGEGREDWDLQITSDSVRKPVLMKFGDSIKTETVSYDDDMPLYLSWGRGQEMTKKAIENIGAITAAIAKGEKVFITIESEFVGLFKT
jgi:hypothetical protein